ncbi:glycosyltransferase family 17 protein [Piromyces sp. E2]|nr:glycosyltransferase family 17 protein [Piromyces sp. E2]|eukprot:OUM70623.1 glycosyltransferase family 17 protein [Piromyces sp. E2]
MILPHRNRILRIIRIGRKKITLILLCINIIFFLSNYIFDINSNNKIKRNTRNAVGKNNKIVSSNNDNNNKNKNDNEKNTYSSGENGNVNKTSIITNDDNKNKTSKGKINKNNEKNNNNNKSSIRKNKSNIVTIKKTPYFDQYGIDLNKYIMDEMENTGINNKSKTKINDWKYYTPPCPNLHPIHHSNDVLNPVCEDIAIPFYKITQKGNVISEIPLTLRLSNISTQMKKWKDWVEKDESPPNYKSASMEELVSEEYHPFDYGYYDLEENNDENYYNKVTRSNMDKVPDPRRRRLFSMILFNNEFDLLDIYLSEYYEIVDYFIIYESNSTLYGSKKPLYLTRTLLETNRYENFRDKIIPVTLPIMDQENKNKKTNSLSREHLARRQVIEKGLRAVHARHGDLFFHGNLNELPKARLLSYLKKCGGWEHLQMGIGGGPKPMENENTKSYFVNKKLPVSSNIDGQYIVDYDLKTSLAFSLFTYNYYFDLVENKTISNFYHPNLAIFDARRSLGQYPYYTNDKKIYDVKNNKLVNKFKREYNDDDDDDDDDDDFNSGDDDDNNNDNTNSNSEDDYVNEMDDENNEKSYQNKNNNENEEDSDDDNDDDDNDNINNNDITSNNNHNNNHNHYNNLNINDLNDNEDFDKIRINDDDEIDMVNIQNEIKMKQKYEYKLSSNYNDITNNDDEQLDYFIDDYIDDGIEDGEYGIDPYQGYSYTDNDDFEKKGKGFLGENLRLQTSPKIVNKKQEYDNMLTFWKSGWRISSFYPNINHFISNLSTKKAFTKLSSDQKKKKIIDSINNNIKLNDDSQLETIDVRLPQSKEEKYPNLYSYKLWKNIKKQYNETGQSDLLEQLNELVLHELPQQVWENPICYSYMLDRNYGITKKLWWEIVPKSQWSTLDLNELMDIISKATKTTQDSQKINGKNNIKFIKEDY